MAKSKKSGKKKSAAKKTAPVKKAPAKKSAVQKMAAKKKAATAGKSKALAAPTAKRATPAPKISLNVLEKLLTPLADRLLITVEGASERTAGGIYIPGSVSERPNRGRVLAKGRGKRLKKGSLRPLDVGVGDVVIFPQFAGTAITLEGTELLILREEEVLGISEN